MIMYFAHPINTYGSEGEAKIIAALKSAGHSIVNPASAACQNEVNSIKAAFTDKAQGSAEVMKYFVKVCNACDIAAFWAFDDGKIGAGIGKEIKSFYDRNADVFEVKLLSNGATLLEKVEFYPADRVLSVDETRARVYSAAPKLVK